VKAAIPLLSRFAASFYPLVLSKSGSYLVRQFIARKKLIQKYSAERDHKLKFVGIWPAYVNNFMIKLLIIFSKKELFL